MENKLYYKSFHISGFTYYEGPLLMKKLKLGKKLILKAEPENRYDENAVAVYYKNKKIGYVPKEKNYSMSKFLNQGHNPFYALIQQVNKNEHPERQFRVAVYIAPSETKTQNLKEDMNAAIANAKWLFEDESDQKLLALKEALNRFFDDEISE